MDWNVFETVFKSELKKARIQTLNLVEASLGKEDNWKHLRKCLLDIYGKKGLEGLLLKLRSQNEKMH